MQTIDGDQELRQFFLEEAESVATSIYQTLTALDCNDCSESALESVRRGFHTLKGGAAQMTGFDSLADCSQKAERLVQGIVSRIAIPSQAVLALLIDAARENLALIRCAREDGSAPCSSALSGRLEQANQRLREAERLAAGSAECLLRPQSIDDVL